MPELSERLALVALGVQGDAPPLAEQPPLGDGNHLRWAFERSAGFPWYGFFLYRRTSRAVERTCPVGAGRPAIELAGGRADLAVAIPEGDVATWVGGEIAFRRGPAAGRGSVLVTATRRGVPVATARVPVRPGATVGFALTADAIDTVRFTDGDGAGPLPDAVLTELCHQPLLLTAGLGWEPLAGPIALPVRHPDYPASGNRVPDEAASRAEADGRLRHPAPPSFGSAEFGELHASLTGLVEGGPAVPMADASRAPDRVGVPLSASGAALPTMPAQHPLDLVLLASLHPAMAQMLGLYWLDDTAEPGVAYDYLLLADGIGLKGADPVLVLEAWRDERPGVDGAVASWVVAGPVAPLDPPADVRAYALPGGTLPVPGRAVPDAGGAVVRLAGSVGLRWRVPTVGDTLLPRSAVCYHVWRDAQGDAAAPAPTGGLGVQLTARGPAGVAAPVPDPFHPVQWPPHWPATALHRIDALTDEGWYGYRVCGVDLFGRFSRPSGPARWYQWAPEPAPRPWYYTDPPAESVVHPSAVRILDKLAPPPPAGVEATVLDPADPHLLRDAAYTAWRATVAADLVGLRVTWRWTAAQRAQAPDTTEFRLYLHPGHPGSAAPGPDPHEATSWQDRVHVVPIGEGAETAGGSLRFQVFLPDRPDAVLAAGVPLTPTPAEPVRYAQVGVSAADGAPHTPDDAGRSGAVWGGRPGNEGRVGGPVTVLRVRREPPPPPVVPGDAERVFATPADYAGRSFHTYRWTPAADLRTHVYRALDDAVAAADRRRRPRAPLLPDDAAFPPEWDVARRERVAAELDALNDAGDAGAYRALSDDGLRVLAGLPGAERAFTPVTAVPLDPDDPATADRPGPDDPPDHPADPALRRYVDTLDGRATNRYLYRCAHVDGAHNTGPLSTASPPVWLPKVTAPRTPALRSAVGGESTVTLEWAANREPDLAGYRVYRAGGEAAARDVRAMTPLHTEPPGTAAVLRWSDAPVPAQTTLWYRLTAVDTAGNESVPTPPVAARAHRTVPPAAPEWVEAVRLDGGVHLAWLDGEPGLSALVSRRADGTARWVAVSGWLAPGVASFDDAGAEPAVGYFYRVQVRDGTGNVALAAPARFVPAAP